MNETGCKKTSSVQRIMRALHRDIGYFLIGFTLIYCFSGIVMIYRGNDFLRFDKVVTEMYDPNLSEDELIDELPFRSVTIIKNDTQRIEFEQGYYEKATGKTTYTSKQYPTFIRKMNVLHRSTQEDGTHWVSVVFAALLIFLALSSFWMFTSRSKFFKRGIILSLIGFVIAVVLMYLS